MLIYNVTWKIIQFIVLFIRSCYYLNAPSVETSKQENIKYLKFNTAFNSTRPKSQNFKVHPNKIVEAYAQDIKFENRFPAQQITVSNAVVQIPLKFDGILSILPFFFLERSEMKRRKKGLSNIRKATAKGSEAAHPPFSLREIMRVSGNLTRGANRHIQGSEGHSVH